LTRAIAPHAANTSSISPSRASSGKFPTYTVLEDDGDDHRRASRREGEREGERERERERIDARTRARRCVMK
jgi:hypothetical protein